MSNKSDNSSVDESNKMEADSTDSSKRKATETIDPRPAKAQKTDNNSPSSVPQSKDIEVIDLEDAQPPKNSAPQSQPASAKSDESAINPNLALVNSLLSSSSLPDIKNKAFKGSIFDFGEFFGVIDGPYNGSYVISICLQDQVFSGVLNKNPSVTSTALKELIQKQAPEMTIATQGKSDATISLNNKNTNNEAKSATSTTPPATAATSGYQIPPLSSLTDTAAYGEQATRAALSALSSGQFGGSNFGRTGTYPYSQDEAQAAMQQQLLYNQLLQSYQMRQYQQQQQAVQEYLQQQYQHQVQLQKQQQTLSLKPIQPMPVPTAAVTPAPNLVTSSATQSASLAGNTSKSAVTTSTLKSWTHSGPDKEKQVVFTASSISAEEKKKKEPIAITTKIHAIKPTPMSSKSDADFKVASRSGTTGSEKKEQSKEKYSQSAVVSGNTVKFKESKEYLHELGFKIVQTILQQYYYQQIAATPSAGTASATGTTTNTISIVNNSNTNGTPANQPSDPRAPIEISDV